MCFCMGTFTRFVYLGGVCDCQKTSIIVTVPAVFSLTLQADTQLPLGDGGTNEALAAGGDCTNGALSADGDGTNGVPAPIEVDSSPEKIKQEQVEIMASQTSVDLVVVLVRLIYLVLWGVRCRSHRHRSHRRRLWQSPCPSRPRTSFDRAFVHRPAEFASPGAGVHWPRLPTRSKASARRRAPRMCQEMGLPCHPAGRSWASARSALAMQIPSLCQRQRLRRKQRRRPQRRPCRCRKPRRRPQRRRRRSRCRKQRRQPKRRPRRQPRREARRMLVRGCCRIQVAVATAFAANC